MTKSVVDTLIQNMKKAGILTKATAWMVEGIVDKQMNVRYVGIKPYEQWLEILSEKNNLLLKFIIDKNNGTMELYLANTPPFIKIITKQITGNEKWEVLLGEISRRLHREKLEYQNHTEQLGNMYVRLIENIK